MLREERILFAEAAITYSLFRRIHTYAPQQAEKIKSTFSGLEWGKSIQTLWKKEEKFTPLYLALNEEIDKNPAPLISIFSRLDIFGLPLHDQYYAPRVWDEPVIFPEASPPDLSTLGKYWETIAIAWQSFIRNAPESGEARLTSFLTWCDEHTGSIPVSEKLATVSLSNHLKTMAAIAIACGEEDSFQVVLGDVSGIQSYLFDISHIGAGKVAKRLRARSFSLGLISECAAHKLLEQSDMPICNLLLSAGGIFYALLPAGLNLSRWKEKINDSLFSRYHGSISLHSAVCTVHLSELRTDFSSTISTLHQQLQNLKGKGFSSILQSAENSNWNTAKFVHRMPLNGVEFCESCRRYPKKKGHSEFCSHCATDEEVGRKLPRAHFVLFQKGEGTFQVLDGIGISLKESLTSIPENTYLIQTWNDARIPTGLSLPVQQRWVANYVPLTPESGCPHCKEDEEAVSEPGMPLSFSCLAHTSEGKEMLAYFKADVDNLGLLLSFGLLSDKEDASYSLSQIATLSRMLERFFSGGINLWLKETFTKTYTVFSGGDDLFLVGPWSQIIDAAHDIQEKFESFVGHNPNVTLSAGISIVKPKVAIPHATREVENSLEHAKEIANYIRVKKKGDQAKGRNQVTIRRTSMDWNDFQKITRIARQLAAWWQEDKIKSSFIYKLLTYYRMYEAYEREKKTEALMFIPLLAYTIQRNLIEAAKGESNNDTIEWANRLTNIHDPQVQWLWNYMRTIIELAQLYRYDRGGDKNGH